MMKKMLIGTGAIALSLLASAAHATTFTFDEYFDGNSSGTVSLEKDRFKLNSYRSRDSEWSMPPALEQVTEDHVTSQAVYHGSNAGYNSFNDDISIYNSYIPNGFTFESIDLAPGSFSAGTTSVTFSASKTNGTLVSTTVSYNNGLAFQHFSFAGFNNLLYLQIKTANSTEFDNVVLSADTIPAVPEPETYAMLLAGLGLLTFMRRRRA
jgi:hypothetical protein